MHFSECAEGFCRMPPAWVIDKLRERVAEGDTLSIIVQLFAEHNFSCTARQLDRWKVKHKIRRQWQGSDAALDAIVRQLIADDELGEDEGYRWVHSVVNTRIPGGLCVGRNRVQASLRRVVPALVDARKNAVERQLQRRVYVADYFMQRSHIDLMCKLIFGHVRLYVYGHVSSNAALPTRRARP